MITAVTGWRDRLAIIHGDITQSAADAIVNSASHSLVGRAGLSGAILTAGGEELCKECASLGGCESGDAKITNAYGLSARHIIHAVSPVWYGGYDREDELLAQCYLRCFELVEENKHQTVMFPSLGTGAHGFPISRAVKIALRSIIEFLKTDTIVRKITIVCFEHADYEVYSSTLREEVWFEARCVDPLISSF
jgi:O-acetyl-ADP-ribose deacetylase (regulator of RNase III)